MKGLDHKGQALFHLFAGLILYHDEIRPVVSNRYLGQKDYFCLKKVQYIKNWFFLKQFDKTFVRFAAA